MKKGRLGAVVLVVIGCLALLRAGCTLLILYYDLEFEDGLIFRGAVFDGPIQYGEMRGSTGGSQRGGFPPPLDFASLETSEFLIGETDFKIQDLKEIDRDLLMSIGLEKSESQGLIEVWFRRYKNGFLRFAFYSDGSLESFAHHSYDTPFNGSVDPKHSPDSIRFRIEGKPEVSLPMTEEEIRAYFGKDYYKRPYRGLEF